LTDAIVAGTFFEERILSRSEERVLKMKKRLCGDRPWQLSWYLLWTVERAQRPASFPWEAIIEKEDQRILFTKR